MWMFTLGITTLPRPWQGYSSVPRLYRSLNGWHRIRLWILRICLKSAYDLILGLQESKADIYQGSCCFVRSGKGRVVDLSYSSWLVVWPKVCKKISTCFPWSLSFLKHLWWCFCSSSELYFEILLYSKSDFNIQNEEHGWCNRRFQANPVFCWQFIQGVRCKPSTILSHLHIDYCSK